MLKIARSDKTEARRLQRLAQEGQLRRIHPGIYTEDLDTPLETVTRRHLNEICAVIMPGCIVSHRSAFEHRPTTGGQYFLTGAPSAIRASRKLPKRSSRRSGIGTGS